MTENSSDPKLQQARREHFQKVLKNFVALSQQVGEFMPESKEIDLCLNRLTESGMWFRMAFDLEQASQPQVAQIVLKDKNGNLLEPGKSQH